MDQVESLPAPRQRAPAQRLVIPGTSVSDPAERGLVIGLARPGGNVTGLSTFAPELVSKCLQLLTQAVPGLSRVAALWHPGEYVGRMEKDMLKRAEVAARA